MKLSLRSPSLIFSCAVINVGGIFEINRPVEFEGQFDEFIVSELGEFRIDVVNTVLVNQTSIYGTFDVMGPLQLVTDRLYVSATGFMRLNISAATTPPDYPFSLLDGKAFEIRGKLYADLVLTRSCRRIEIRRGGVLRMVSAGELRCPDVVIDGHMLVDNALTAVSVTWEIGGRLSLDTTETREPSSLDIGGFLTRPNSRVHLGRFDLTTTTIDAGGYVRGDIASAISTDRMFVRGGADVEWTAESDFAMSSPTGGFVETLRVNGTLSLTSRNCSSLKLKYLELADGATVELRQLMGVDWLSVDLHDGTDTLSISVCDRMFVRYVNVVGEFDIINSFAEGQGIDMDGAEIYIETNASLSFLCNTETVITRIILSVTDISLIFDLIFMSD